MARYLGLLIATWALLVVGILFFALSVGGVLFGGASRPNDLGVYAVTVTFLFFGLGAFLLRKAKMQEPGPTP